ncbi:hypothetical protein Tco_0410140 [Tanacetum coccineum]
MSSSSSFGPTECKCGLPLMTSTPGHVKTLLDDLKIEIKHCKRWDWCDLELEIKWYKDHLYEMHLLLSPSQREELKNGLTSREELAVLQVEFADMEGQMQKLMEELKKSQKNAFFWKSTAIVFAVVASFMFVMN